MAPRGLAGETDTRIASPVPTAERQGAVAPSCWSSMMLFVSSIVAR